MFSFALLYVDDFYTLVLVKFLFNLSTFATCLTPQAISGEMIFFFSL